jgi:membrane-bound lytic murein transglycosylase D
LKGNSLKKQILWSILIAVVVSGITFTIYYYYDLKTPEVIYKIYDTQIDKAHKDDFPFQYIIETPKLPKKLDFCGEDVPLYNFDVYERIERELISNTYWHSSTLLVLKRSGRWFPVIVPILKKYGIPEDFKYLAVVESNLENQVSPAHAAGFWQLLKDTGRYYGLVVNKYADERYDPWRATEAAAKYLLKAKKKFGTWTLAAVSYNVGMSQLQKQIKRQRTKVYYNMNLNDETARYLFRMLAIKAIFENPAEYGFLIDKSQLYKPLEFTTEKVKHSINDLAKWAEIRGLNYRTLKLYNPWLRDNYLKVKRKQVFYIRIPTAESIDIIPER